MARLATTTALSIWIGFLATHAGAFALRAWGGGAVEAVSGRLSAIGAGALSSVEVLAATPAEATLYTALLALLAGCLGGSLTALHSVRSRRRAKGEQLAAATLSALVALYAAAALSGSGIAGIFGQGPNTLFYLALSFAALLFDHLLDDDDEEEGDAAYAATLAAIVASMSAERVVTPPRPPEGNRKPAP